MRLLDTNICIYILKNKPVKVLEKFKKFNIGELKLSSITVAELYFGAYNSSHIEKKISVIQRFLIPFEIVNFDEKAAIEYGKIKAKLRKNGNIIGELDIQIASIAISNNLILVTNNIKEFAKIENLEFENWM